MSKPVWVIIIGLVMEVSAIALILLILLGVIRSSYFVNFFAFTISVAGLIMGMIGSASLVKIKKDEYKNRH